MPIPNLPGGGDPDNGVDDVAFEVGGASPFGPVELEYSGPLWELDSQFSDRNVTPEEVAQEIRRARKPRN